MANDTPATVNLEVDEVEAYLLKTALDNEVKRRKRLQPSPEKVLTDRALTALCGKVNALPALEAECDDEGNDGIGDGDE